MLGADHICVTRLQWVTLYSELHYHQHSSRQNSLHVYSTYVQTKGRQFKPCMVSVLFDGTGFLKQSNGQWLETTSQLSSPLWELLKQIVPGGDFVTLVNRMVIVNHLIQKNGHLSERVFNIFIQILASNILPRFNELLDFFVLRNGVIWKVILHYYRSCSYGSIYW